MEAHTEKGPTFGANGEIFIHLAVLEQDLLQSANLELIYNRIC